MDKSVLVEMEIERYKEELVKHCNKTLDLIAEARINEDVNNVETQEYLRDLLTHALKTQRDIANANERITTIRLRRKLLGK